MAEEARTVALVGRPNVGKSRLFNRLVGQRLAIVHDRPGVTRDVQAAELPEAITLLDTGGIGLVAEMGLEALVEAAEEQVFVALEAADLIIFVVDAQEGITSLDEIVAERLRPAGKKVWLVMNKADHPRLEERSVEFAALGFGDPTPVSAEHARGTDILRNQVLEHFGPAPIKEETDTGASEGVSQRRLAISFVGRPNVGKSSLVNRLLQNDRLVVSEVPGTTRDAIGMDLDFTPEGAGAEPWPFRLVDTAGLRRPGKVRDPVEYFSRKRTERALAESDVVFLVIDARDGVTKADQALAGQIVEAGRPMALVINKWDFALETFAKNPLPGYDSERDFRKAFAKAAAKELFFLPDSPQLYVSARSGHGMEELLPTARELDERAATKLSTGRLNNFLGELMERNPPRVVDGRRFKLYYTVQTGSRPLRLRLFCNRKARLDDSYRRYLENNLRATFDLRGIPLRFDLREKAARYSTGKTGR